MTRRPEPPARREAPCRAVVLLVEDDPIMGEALCQRFVLEGVDVTWVQTGRDGLAMLRRRRVDLLICDIKLPDISGEDLFREALPELGRIPIIFITAFGEIEQAVRLVRAGANDYLTKPFRFEQLMERVRRLDAASSDGSPVPAIAPGMRAVEATLHRVADIDSTVLITGETGVGKEVAARLLHHISPRAEEPFLAVNCAAIPAEIAESQIFGHERGAFTGAQHRHTGFAEQAAGGTLLLDEVGELAPGLQAKLLRLIQERSFMRIGGSQAMPFRARLVAAANEDLEAAVRAGRFREDLWFRLAVIPIRIPPLRERQEEILPMARHFLAQFAHAFARPVERFSADVAPALARHGWPGNVRELRNRIERAVALATGPEVATADLFPERALLDQAAEGTQTLSQVREQAEREHIRAVLADTGGRIGEAALRLQVSRTTLWERMRKLGLSGNDDEG